MPREVDENGVALEDKRKLTRVEAVVVINRLARDLRYAVTEKEQNKILKQMQRVIKEVRNAG